MPVASHTAVMDDERRIAAAAERLAEAAGTRRPCAPVRDLIGDDADLAYAVQRAGIDSRTRQDASVVGRKVGLTSKAVQTQLGVDQPDFGTLLDVMRVASGGIAPHGRLLQPRAEAELAFVLGADLHEPGDDLDAVRAAIAYATAAIEIVDSRIAGWDITFSDTVADNGSSGLFVLGDERLDLATFEPVAVTMSLSRIDGEGATVVSTGTGAACLGDPLRAMAWLATTLDRAGTPLRAGEVVLSGALGPMVDAEPGVTYTAHLKHAGAPLSSVSVTFSEHARQVQHEERR